MAVDTNQVVMEIRSCAHCGRQFKTMIGSAQKWCSKFCRIEDEHDGKWKSWKSSKENFKKLEGSE